MTILRLLQQRVSTGRADLFIWLRTQSLIVPLLSRSLEIRASVMINIYIVFQLRYLQALTNVSIENNQTIVFPVPVQLINRLSQMMADRRRNQ